MPSEDPPAERDGLPIQAVSTLLAVPAATIRSWERRYGIATATRTVGRHRRYSPEDVNRLRLMRDEITRGRPPAEAAVLVRDAVDNDDPQRGRIEAFLDSARAMNTPRLHVLLDQCNDRLGIEHTICDVILPAMRQIGVAWQTGQCDIGQEHLATYATRRWLDKILAQGPTSWQPHTIALSCGPADRHTVALEALEVLLAHRGWARVMLGELTPATALAAALHRTNAAAAVVVSHLAANRAAAVAAINAADRAGVQVFYAGNAFLDAATRSGVPGAYLGTNVIAAADTICSSLSTTAGAQTHPRSTPTGC